MMMLYELQTCPCWGGGNGMGGWGMNGGPMWGFGMFWPLLWLLVLAVIVIGVVYLFSNRTSVAESSRAMDVLRERYARGEIGEEEFDERAARLYSR